MGPQQVVMVLDIEGWIEGFIRRGGEREGGSKGSTFGVQFASSTLPLPVSPKPIL